MPELPEVEVLVRHLAPLLRHRAIQAVEVRREKVIAPHSRREFSAALRGARFDRVRRRGKYLAFTLRSPRTGETFKLLGHLGMTGRMYLLPAAAPLPRHAAVVFCLGRHQLVFEDTRYFGRLTLNPAVLDRLGPEPLQRRFTPQMLASGLKRSAQAIKVKLLEQSLLAGIGNIYASEALFRARISPRRPARSLSPVQVKRLWRAIRRVLGEAIRFGSTVPLDWTGTAARGALFYYGRAAGAPDYYEERLQVYDRAGKPCPKCGATIRKIAQVGRSTFFCPHCQN